MDTMLRKRVSAKLPTYVTSLQSAVPGNVATFPAGSGGGLLQAGDLMVVFASANSSGGTPSELTPAGFTLIGSQTGSHSFAGDPREFARATASYKILTSGDVTSGGNLTNAILTNHGDYKVQLGAVYRPSGTVTTIGTAGTFQKVGGDAGPSVPTNLLCPLSQIPANAQRLSVTFGRTVAAIVNLTGEPGGTTVDHTGLTGNSGVSPYGHLRMICKEGNGDNVNFTASITPQLNGMWFMLMAVGLWFISNRSLKEIIDANSLATGLVACLDAGDDVSTGTANVWTDLSGTNNYFLGTATAGDAAQPTLVGGRNRWNSDYYSLDGGDYFTCGVALPAWARDLSIANAAWTVYSVNYFGGALSNPSSTFATFASTATPGVWAGTTSTGMSAYVQGTGAGNFVQAIDTALVPATGVWNRMAWAVSDSTDLATMMLNGVIGTDKAFPYATPGVATAVSTTRLTQFANATLTVNFWPAGSRIAMVAIWTRKLTNAELAALDAAVQAERQYGVAGAFELADEEDEPPEPETEEGLT